MHAKNISGNPKGYNTKISTDNGVEWDRLTPRKLYYCILRGRIKGFNSSITIIMCQVGSYRTVVG